MPTAPKSKEFLSEVLCWGFERFYKHCTNKQNANFERQYNNRAGRKMMQSESSIINLTIMGLISCSRNRMQQVTAIVYHSKILLMEKKIMRIEMGNHLAYM